MLVGLTTLISFYLVLVFGVTESRKAEGVLMKDLRVDCNKDTMIVTVDFFEPFTGIIYSRGYHGDPACRYVEPNRLGSTSVTFGVPLDRCGTSSQFSGGRGVDMYMENIIVIQGDPDIQEAWDVARKVRCVWRHTYARTVTAKPFQVFQPPGSGPPYGESSEPVKAVMEVQEGRGPFSRPSSGYLHLGEESSLVIYVQDPSRRMDARMVDCRAFGSDADPRAHNVLLIDDQGCPVRPDLISPFYKTKDTRNTGADLIMYTHFKAFKLPDSSKFNIRCQMQVCDKVCPDRCTRNNLTRRRTSRFRRGLLTRVKREDSPPGPPFRLLERRVEIVSDEEEPTPVRQVCLLESSWIAMSGTVTAGYLFLLLCIWVLFWRMRSYSRLLFQAKMEPAIVVR